MKEKHHNPTSVPMKTDKEWNQLKLEGESHYKTGGGVEPIDLLRDGGMLKHFALGNIIKYAFRNRQGRMSERDIDDIIGYARMLKVLCHEGE